MLERVLKRVVSIFFLVVIPYVNRSSLFSQVPGTYQLNLVFYCNVNFSLEILVGTVAGLVLDFVAGMDSWRPMEHASRVLNK